MSDKKPGDTQPLERLDPDPVRQFRQWLQDAKQVGMAQPYAMTLATAGGDSTTSARIVLLRGSTILVFFTNYDSLKGQHLQRESFRRAAVLLARNFIPSGSHCRRGGTVGCPKASDRYFAGRPRGPSSTHASPQNRVISGRGRS